MKKAILLSAVLIIGLLIPSAFSQDTTFQIPADSSVINTAPQSFPAIDSASADTVYPISPERRAMLNQYSDFKLGWQIFYEISNWVLLLLIAFLGVSYALLRLAEKISSNKISRFLLYLLFFQLLLSLVTFPLDYYRDFVIEHKYGFSNQTFGAWLGEMLKSFPVSYIAMAIILGLMYFLLRKFPSRWWLYFSIGAVPFIILSIVVVPVLVSPLFNDFKPLQDQQLKTEILSLASKAGIEGADVFEVDASRQSSKLNAYVTGLFATKRIVLYDTIIKAMTREELFFVMAHEMGHYVMNHVWIMVGMISVMLFVSVWLTSRILPAMITRYKSRFKIDNLTSYASLPLLLFAISFIMFFIQPVTNGIARNFERACDKYGMEMTGYNSEAAAVAFEKLSAYNLSNPNPGAFVEFWFYDHPALDKRIDFVKKYGREHTAIR